MASSRRAAKASPTLRFVDPRIIPFTLEHLLLTFSHANGLEGPPRAGSKLKGTVVLSNGILIRSLLDRKK
jgi:hypothetical protein